MTAASSPQAGVQLGDLIAGKYRVDRVIGKGGMGLVVAALHTTLDEQVALKFLLPEFATHPQVAPRFLREARAAVKIKSEHVGRVLDAGVDDTGAHYMVMELLEGSDLGKVLDEGVLPVADAIDYVIQAGEAIAEAHSLHIVHRDLKPSNLFRTRRADGSSLIKVIDFGITKRMDCEADKLTRPGAPIGSLRYMSPEQLKGEEDVDHRTDIYALGVTLFELLGGETPYSAGTVFQLYDKILQGDARPLRDLREEVTEELAMVIAKAYAWRREERYQSVAELAEALAPFAPSRSETSIKRISGTGRARQSNSGGEAREAEPRTVPLPAAVVPEPAEQEEVAPILPPEGTPVAIAKSALEPATVPVAIVRDLPRKAEGPPMARKGTATITVLLALALLFGASLALLIMRRSPPAPEAIPSAAPPPQAISAPVASETPRLAEEPPSTTSAAAIPAVAATMSAPSASIPGRPLGGGPGGRPKGKGTAAPTPPTPPPAKKPEDYGI